MKRRLLRWTLSACATLVVAGALYALLRPTPIEVDVLPVQRGPLIVTVDEQAETRSHDRFVVAAPVAGRVLRVNLHEGDLVAAGQTVAELAPAPLGEREIRELEARLTSARSLQREAQERLGSAEQDLALAGRNRVRLQGLAERKLVAEQALDQAMTAEAAAAHAVRAAAHRLASAAADVDQVRAGLISTPTGASRHTPTLLVRAPVGGRVLRVAEKSDRVVPAGSQLMVVGDLSQLEVLIELLSVDAVKIRPGMPVLLDGWGGDRVLHARVSVVEPFAFTKVSALGVEEKRANVIAEFLEPPAPLGDGYRLSAHIVTFTADAVVKVAASALFPCGQGSCLFTVEKDRARQRPVSIGHRTADSAEVLDGLTIGTRVICYPPNDLQDGARIKVRLPQGH
jgi:HlyD family secretion protein